MSFGSFIVRIIRMNIGANTVSEQMSLQDVPAIYGCRRTYPIRRASGINCFDQVSFAKAPVFSALRIDPNRFRYCAGVRFTLRLNNLLKNPASS